MPNPTHEVTNQPPPLVGWNLFDATIAQGIYAGSSRWSRPGAHAARAALGYMWQQVRSGAERGSLHVLPRAS
jgi:hypothetical protein